MGHVQQRHGNSKKNQKETLEIKSTGTNKVPLMDWFISGLDIVKERISELDGVSIETSQTEM